MLAAGVLCALGFSQSGQAQGTIYFANRFSTNSVVILQAPIYGPEPQNLNTAKIGNTGSGVPAGIPAGTQTYGGALLWGSNYRVQLFAAPGANQPERLLMPASISTFRTGGAAGLIPLTIVTLANVPADAPFATVQLRAWDNSSGQYPTWADAAQAWCVAAISAGKSAPMVVRAIGGTTNPPPIMTDLRSFNLFISWAPQILMQPQSLTVPRGATATFRAFVVDQCNLAYQWLHNGDQVPGATDEVLTLTNVQAKDFGEYKVRVSFTPDLYSDTATLTELPPPYLTLLRASNSAVQLGFQTQSTATYLIQSSPDLVAWTNFEGPFAGDGMVWSKVYSNLNAAQLFLRVGFVP